MYPPEMQATLTHSLIGCVAGVSAGVLGSDDSVLDFQRGPYPAGVFNPNPTSARRILVVEDDSDLLDTMSRILERAGFVIHRAHDGQEGWREIASSHFDLVITDNEMPGLDGVTMIKRLRADSHEPPCLLISGCMDGREAALRASISPGAVLAKPFSSMELIEIVMHLLLRGDCESP
jgi:two-component system, chemotaxis family, chemotaxis protein CheY